MVDNGWDQWKNLVLEEIKDQKKSLECLEKTLVMIQVDIGRLKLQAGLWGLVGGAISIGLSILIGAMAGLRIWGT